MGSEQSQHSASDSHLQNRNNATRLQRGNTIAVSGRRLSSPNEDPGPVVSNSRPVSPPISVCSDSDLPYCSYTDSRPIGGKLKISKQKTLVNLFQNSIFVIDSPKFRNKAIISSNSRNNRNVNTTKKTILSKTRAKSLAAHDIVVVREANKRGGIEVDPDLQRLQVKNYDFRFQ